MEVTEFKIPGLKLIKPNVFGDKRGFFMERYNKKAFEEAGIDVEFVQDNFSRSGKNVLRGLHYQKEPYAQAKLVFVTRGEVLDVAVDIRQGSPTYGEWESVVLSEENKLAFFIPIGFAHGFLTLNDTVDFQYKTTNYYAPDHDRGIKWNDQELNIDWGVEDPTVSEKDTKLPSFHDTDNDFIY